MDSSFNTISNSEALDTSPSQSGTSRSDENRHDSLHAALSDERIASENRHACPDEFFHAIADASVDPTLVITEDGQIVFANDAARIFVRIDDGSDMELAAAPVLRIDPVLVPALALQLASRHGTWTGESVVARSARRSQVFLLQIVAIAENESAGRPAHFGIIARDVTREHAREAELKSSNSELRIAYTKLQGTQDQLVQSEKLASIGQLAAGVAHEINNPIGYVHSNLGTLSEYTRQLLALIETYDSALRAAGVSELSADIEDLRERLDIDFLASDLPKLLAESREGIERVRVIVQNLKDFSRTDATDAWSLADIHGGLDATLNIAWNELKYKAQVVKTFGELPLIECVPSELNQVFMNILVNAGQALVERGMITVTTSSNDTHVSISIGDDGHGIPDDVLPRIFDPFYTTKPTGSGTGLGLSISYGIVKKHHGTIQVTSTPSQGTLFCIELPIRQPKADAASAT
ncbi:MAG: ATP-binding protein [Dokdonella sp.]